MVRETRGSIGRDTATPSTDVGFTGAKRKRRTSSSPAPNAPITTTIKMALPPTASEDPTVSTVPSSEVGGAEHEAKRQRLSLRVTAANGTARAPEALSIAEEEIGDEDAEGEIDDEGEVEVETNGAKGDGVGGEKLADTIAVKKQLIPVGSVLPKDVRTSVALVLAQMASGLPPPLNNLLTLWLPPDFAPKEENTLRYVLNQEDLTWEKLVAILHLFSENLLLPCGYPNPVPSLSRIHLPVSPLPSHFPPLSVYTACVAFHQLLLQIEPRGNTSLGSTPVHERWALMQKTPGNGLGTSGGEWFTASANLREVETALAKAKPESGKTLLETMALAGDKFGHAQPVIVQATGPIGSGENTRVPILAESVIRRASLKAQRWKETRSIRRAGGFAHILRPVTIPSATASTSFTPSFAPLYDSSQIAGGMGYYSTLDAMHEAARRREWTYRTAKAVEDAGEVDWIGVLDKAETSERVKSPDVKGKGKETVNDILQANGQRIRELQAWQRLRLRRGDETWITEREQVVADEVADSLAELAAAAPPSALLPPSFDASPGFAHKLAQRHLSNRAPIIRGILDPRRTHALHDNVTVKLRAQAAAAIGSTPSALGVNSLPPSPHAPPPAGSMGYMPPPSGSIREPPPHILPPNSRYYVRTPGSYTPGVPVRAVPPSVPGQSTAQLFRPPPNSGGYSRVGTTPSGLSGVGIPPGLIGQSPSPSPAHGGYQQRPIGPGPSNLRQSFGPGIPLMGSPGLPGTPGSGYSSPLPVRGVVGIMGQPLGPR